jgi:hypothetical protein
VARIESVELVDDLDPTVTATETVEFELDGKRYEIDLSDTNTEALRDALAPYIAAARPAGKPNKTGKPGRPRRDTPSRDENQAIREWARNHGMDVAERGRISTEIVDAYHAA